MKTITYDSELSQMFYDMLSPTIKNRACPFCGVRVNIGNFKGAINHDGELRMIDGSLPCLIELAKDIA